MHVAEAIRQRRSVSKFKDERPPRAAIEQILEAGTRAPNHFLTQPWHFCVVAGKAREELGRLLAARLRAKKGEPTRPEDEAALRAEAEKPLRAPVLIAVGVKKTDNPRAVWQEEIAAGAAAAENMLLMAEELGLGAAWRTGAYDDPEVRAFFGLGPEDALVGVIYVGYPDGSGEPKPRAPFAEKTVWKGWE